MTALRRRFALAGLMAAVLVLASGCERRARVEYPGGADSLASAGVDSASIQVREAQQAWEIAGGGEAAARASARVLALTLPSGAPDQWAARAQAFLDSLGVGAEVVAGECALAVNFFSRSDPADGSWPHLFWCGERGVESQPIDGGSMRLLLLASRGLRPGGERDSTPPAVALLFDRRARLGTEPYLMQWSRRPTGWEVTQTLGPDSLGGAGTGEFEALEDTLTLVTRTYRTSRGFEECPTCPHVYRVRRFAWERDGFVKREDVEAPSPYSTFVRFIQALLADDRATAEALVTARDLVDAARRAGLAQARGLWRVAPATDETATHMVFLRGTSEAYDVGFVLQSGAWRIDRIEVTEQRHE